MESCLNHAAKGTGSRFARWYALAHAARCGPCRKFLEKLEKVLDELAQAKAANPTNVKVNDLMELFLQAKSEEAPESNT
jgi:NADH:ubiquinone oxidoreductase subunit F (NADH-binding)